MTPQKKKFKLDLKNLAMLPSNFDHIFVHLRQKVRLRPEIFINFRPEPGPSLTENALLDLYLCISLPYMKCRKNKTLHQVLKCRRISPKVGEKSVLRLRSPNSKIDLV